jgi:hypothetical protein
LNRRTLKGLTNILGKGCGKNTKSTVKPSKNIFWGWAPHGTLHAHTVFCQSVMYFHNDANSCTLMAPEKSVSNMLIMSRTVSGLNGCHVPLDSCAAHRFALNKLAQNSTVLSSQIKWT